MPTTDDIVRIAKAAVAARVGGASTWNHAQHLFQLNVGGMCARFVRQCHETAMGLGEQEWSYRAANAVRMERKLAAASTQVNRPVPGCIVCLNRGTGANGHIGLYVGDGMLAENTSAHRGKPYEPGTKFTPLALLEARVTGYYLALPRGSGLRVLSPTGEEIQCDPVDSGGTTLVALQPLAEALGYDVDVGCHPLALRPLAEALGYEVDARAYPLIQLRRKA